MVADLAAENQPGAGRAKRWFARALLVVGGAVAGTAAAWLFATATAAASPSVPADLTGAITDGLGESAKHVVSFADKAAIQIRHADAAVKQVSESVFRPLNEVTTETATKTTQAIAQLLRGSEHAAPQELRRAIASSSQLGEQVWRLLTPPQQGLTEFLTKLSAELFAPHSVMYPSHRASHRPVVTNDAAESENLGAAARVKPRNSAPADAQRDESQDPRLPYRAPFSPVSIPVVPGASAGGHCDLSLPTLPTGAMVAVTATALGLAQRGQQHVLVEPGSQPGVTPD